METSKDIKYGCSIMPKKFKTFEDVKIIKVNERGVFTWMLMNHSEDFTRERERELLKTIFDKLTIAFRGVRFQEVFAREENTIPIWYSPKDHEAQTGCPFHFDGEGGTLAHAFWNYGGKLSRHVHIDEAENYKEIDYVTVIMHEILHTFGFDHSDDPAALMFWSYTGKKEIGVDDQRAIDHLYGDEIARAHAIYEEIRLKDESEEVVDQIDRSEDDDPLSGCAHGLAICVLFWAIVLISCT